MAQAVQTRCPECRRFVRRRLDVLGREYDELEYSYNEAEYVSEWEEHDCQPSASMAPRAGEHDAWLASIGADGPVEEWADEPAALAPSLGQSIRNISINSEEVSSDDQQGTVPVVRPAGRAPVRARRGRVAPDARGLHGPAVGQPARRGGAQPVRPADPVGGGEQLSLGGSAGPGRQRHRVRPAPYPTSGGAGRVRPAARLARGGADPIPLAGVARDRDAAAAQPRARRGGLRLSRLLRWFQQDDPRLARPLERIARAAEWVEHLYDT